MLFHSRHCVAKTAPLTANRVKNIKTEHTILCDTLYFHFSLCHCRYHLLQFQFYARRDISTPQWILLNFFGVQYKIFDEFVCSRRYSIRDWPIPRYFSVFQVNIGYFRWFHDNTILGLLIDSIPNDVYSPPLWICQSHYIVGVPEEQNDSEYEQSEN